MAPSTLARRLLTAQTLPLTGMAIAVLAVLILLGPPEFERHMRMAGHSQPDVLAHGDAAFVSAGLLSVGTGLVLGLVGVVVATVALTRRLGRGLASLKDGAARVASGDYLTPVRLEGVDSELADVATSFNTMAERIATSESVRRRLLTDVAHELRTPVAAIELLAEAVQDGAMESSDAWPAIRQQTERLTRLATDLRDVSAAAEQQFVLEFTPTVLDTLVDRAFAVALPRAVATGVTLIADLHAPDPVDVDPARIGQVLDNLLRNALQHTPPGGTVTVRTAVDARSVSLAVSDDGSGIAEADLPQVFERFYRGAGHRRDRDGGTGVGLAISQGIAAAHGGRITASSSPGEGATFILTLPRRQSGQSLTPR